MVLNRLERGFGQTECFDVHVGRGFSRDAPPARSADVAGAVGRLKDLEYAPGTPVRQLPERWQQHLATKPCGERVFDLLVQPARAIV